MYKSPYNLLQEVYLADDSVPLETNIWKVFACCMMLNRTNRLQVDKVRRRLFNNWPDAISMSKAEASQVTPFIESLGFGQKRAESLIRMSKDFISKDWKDPKELYGIGKYASDAYSIFVKGEYVHDAGDHLLSVYQEWAFFGMIDDNVFERSLSFDPNP